MVFFAQVGQTATYYMAYLLSPVDDNGIQEWWRKRNRVCPVGFCYPVFHLSGDRSRNRNLALGSGFWGEQPQQQKHLAWYSWNQAVGDGQNKTPKE